MAFFRVVHGPEFIPTGIHKFFRNRSRNGTFLWLTGTGIPADGFKNVTELMPEPAPEQPTWGPSVYQGGPKFKIKHKGHRFQRSKLVDWGGQACRLGGPGPPGPPLAPALTYALIVCFDFHLFAKKSWLTR